MPTDMLTARQEAFCRALVSGAGSAAEAARQAGYSANTARAQASRLLDQPNVLMRLDDLRRDAEKARASVCARLWQRTERLADHAEREGKTGLAMRAVDVQIRLVRAMGLPEIPADTSEQAIEAFGGDPVEICGDRDVAEDARADGDAGRDSEIPTRDDGTESARGSESATRDDGKESGRGSETPTRAMTQEPGSGSRSPNRDPQPASDEAGVGASGTPNHGPAVINGRAAKALRPATDVDVRERSRTVAPRSDVGRADPDLLDHPPGHAPSAAERLAAVGG